MRYRHDSNHNFKMKSYILFIQSTLIMMNFVRLEKKLFDLNKILHKHERQSLLLTVFTAINQPYSNSKKKFCSCWFTLF